MMSLPRRGAWIEIKAIEKVAGSPYCRSLHGERGLKFAALVSACFAGSRFPHGERGLKFFSKPCLSPEALSLTTRGAWIEI